MSAERTKEEVRSADVELERDDFMRTLLRELSGTLQEVVGLDDAAGFVSVVGQTMGRQIGDGYRAALGESRLDREQVAEVLVDLKRRIEGGFYVIDQDDEKIVLGNDRCPFEREKVLGRPALCMMTSNVFGTITADNLGYARVDIQEAIALGDEGCRVVVYLKPGDDPDESAGREYFPAPRE